MTATLTLNSFFFLFLFSCVVKLIPLMSVLACYYYSAGIMTLTLNIIVLAAMIVVSSGLCRERFLRGGTFDDERLLYPCPAPSPPFDQSPNIDIVFGGFTNDGAFPGVLGTIQALSQGNMLNGVPFDALTTQQNLVNNAISSQANLLGGTPGLTLGSNAISQANSFPNPSLFP
jgi:hypothetical protein